MTKLNLDLLRALNAQYLFNCYNDIYMDQNQQSNYLQSNFELNNLKNQTNLFNDKNLNFKSNENKPINQTNRKPRFDFPNLVQSILTDQQKNRQNSIFQQSNDSNYQNLKCENKKDQLSLSSSSSSSFLQTDLSSSSFSSSSSQQLLCSSPILPTNLLNPNPLNSSLITNSTISNSECMKSSNLPQLTNNFNQLNLAQQQQFNQTNQYLNKQNLSNNRFNLSNFNLDNKLISNYCINSTAFDKYLTNHSSNHSSTNKTSTKFDYTNCTNFMNNHLLETIEKNNELLNSRLFPAVHKKNQNENNSLTMNNKNGKKRLDHLNLTVFCNGSAIQQSTTKLTNQIKCTQVRKTNRPKKQYFCKYCSRQFTKSYNLTIHERTHTSMY